MQATTDSAACDAVPHQHQTSPPATRLSAQQTVPQHGEGDDDDDDVFYLFLRKQKIGAKLHIYLEEGTYQVSVQDHNVLLQQVVDLVVCRSQLK
jgi:hypothetical protein